MKKLPLFEEKKNKKNTVQDLIFCVLQVIGNIHKFLIVKRFYYHPLSKHDYEINTLFKFNLKVAPFGLKVFNYAYGLK